jgi:hypothetical protein
VLHKLALFEHHYVGVDNALVASIDNIISTKPLASHLLSGSSELGTIFVTLLKLPQHYSTIITLRLFPQSRKGQ